MTEPKPKERLLSEDEYIAKAGEECPYCRSTDIDWESPDVNDNGGLTIPTFCNHCKSEWTEHFELVGYKDGH